MSQPTIDIQPGWFNLIRRLQASVSGNRGHAVLTVRIIIGPDNLPVIWSEPECIKLEPLRSTGDFLTAMAEGSL